MRKWPTQVSAVVANVGRELSLLKMAINKANTDYPSFFLWNELEPRCQQRAAGSLELMLSLPCLRFPRITLRSWWLWCRPYHVYDSRGLPWGLGDCDAVPTMSMIPEDYPESLVIVMPSLPCLRFPRITLRSWLLWCRPNHVHNSWGLPWELGYCDAVPTICTIPEDYPEVLVIVIAWGVTSLHCCGSVLLEFYLDQKPSHTHNYMIMSNPWLSC